jgi:hypothetical protein
MNDSTEGIVMYTSGSLPSVPHAMLHESTPAISGRPFLATRSGEPLSPLHADRYGGRPSGSWPQSISPGR